MTTKTVGGSVCRYKPSGGYCSYKLDAQWIFCWNGELMFVDRLDFGWRIVLPSGKKLIYDELFEALDAWDELQAGK